MADERARFSPDGVALGKEEGDPEELLDAPEFLARFQADLVELGRRFGGHPAALDNAPPEPAASMGQRALAHSE